MSFMFYDLTFLAVFTISIILFLVLKRKSIGREGPIFLYRTKIGLKFMDYISRKCKKTLNFLSWIIIGAGYLSMATMIYLLVNLVFIFSKPEYVQLIKIPPLMPLIPYLPEMFGISWLPPLYFTYWIIILAIIAIVHEGFHGIYARLYHIKIKSTGFGFLGPLLTFFVEPDEKQTKKTSIFNQLSILGAGIFGNLLAAMVFLIILALFFTALYSPAGALFNDYTYSLTPVLSLAGVEIGNKTISVDGLNLTQITADGRDYFVWQENINNLTGYEEGYIKIYQDLPAINAHMQGAIVKINEQPVTNHKEVRKELEKYAPGEKIIVETKNKTGYTSYDINLGESYENSSIPVIGVGVIIPQASGIKGFIYKITELFRDSATYYEPKALPELTEFIYYLIWWIALINIGVALFNILPLPITDGGRFWYLSVLGLTKNKKRAEKSFKIVARIILFIFILLMVFWAIGMF